MTLSEIADFAGRVLLVGVPTVGVMWLLFQKVVERWVDAHFSRRQKDFEHDQAKELQRLRVQLDTVVQGALKLQEREFTLLPEAWEKVSEAYGLALWLSAPMQQYPTVQYLNDAELEEALSKQDFYETQKESIRSAGNSGRDKIWQAIESRKRYGRASAALSEADRFVKANGVFLPEQLLVQLNDLTVKIWHCLTSYETGQQGNDYRMIRDGWQTLRDTGGPIHQSIEAAIRKRLVDQTRFVDDQPTPTHPVVE